MVEQAKFRLARITSVAAEQPSLLISNISTSLHIIPSWKLCAWAPHKVHQETIMAEALAVVGIVSSIIQVVEFSTKVAERLNDFASTVGEVPRAFRHIQTELPLIIDSLRRIKNQAESGSVESATTTAVWPVLKDCQREITRLQNILDKTVPSVGDSSWERRKKAFLSLGKDKEVEEIADSLSRYVRVLTLHQALEGSKPDSQAPPKYEPARPRYFTLVPFDRNAHFVDREDVFKQIDDSFKVRKGSQPKVALFGLGGIGWAIRSIETSTNADLVQKIANRAGVLFQAERKGSGMFGFLGPRCHHCAL